MTDSPLTINVSAISRRTIIGGIAALPAVLIPAGAASAPAPAALHPDVESAFGYLKLCLERKHGGAWWIHIDNENGVVAVSRAVS